MKQIKTKLKKHMSIFLAILMIGTAVPLSIFATDIASGFLTGTDAFRTNTDGIRTNTDAVRTDTDADWDDDETTEYEWRLEGDTIIISGSGEVDMWDCDWSMINTPVKNIIIEDGITILYLDHMFKNVETVTIPKSLIWFDGTEFGAGYGYFSRTVRFIVDSENKNYFTDKYGVLFRGNKTYGATLMYCPSDIPVKDYVIPDGVTSIGEYIGVEEGTTPFYKCENIETISIPSSVEFIHEDAIRECYNIKKIIVSEDNEDFFADEMGVLYVSTSENDYLFDFGVLYCPANIQTNNYTVIEAPNGGTVALGAYAFGDVQVELTVNLPKTFGGWHGDAGIFKGKILFNIDPEHETDWSEKGSFYYKNSYDNEEEINVMIPGGVNSIYRISEGTQNVKCGGRGDLIVPCSAEYILFYDNYYSNERRVHYLGTEEEWNQVDCSAWFDNLIVTVHFASVEEEKPATCTSVGYTEGIYCLECSAYVYGHEEIEIDDHALVYHDEKAPTCTEFGWEAYETCENCDYTTYNEIPKLGHSFTDYVSDGNVTCTADGTKTAKCDNNCGLTDIIKDTATGHSIITHAAKVPTCISFGWESYETCKNCDYSTYVEIPATDHKDGNKDGFCDECSQKVGDVTVEEVDDSNFIDKIFDLLKFIFDWLRNLLK